MRIAAEAAGAAVDDLTKAGSAEGGAGGENGEGRKRGAVGNGDAVSDVPGEGNGAVCRL